jgi:hypothetical protein
VWLGLRLRLRLRLRLGGYLHGAFERIICNIYMIHNFYVRVICIHYMYRCVGSYKTVVDLLASRFPIYFVY